MNLRDRLDRLRSGRAPARPAPPPRRAPDFGALLPGFEYHGPAGACHVGERVYAVGVRHGAIGLDALLDADPHELACLGGDGRLAEIDLTRTVFLDTETTGLAGGTGTYAFLIGAGYYAASLPGGPIDRFVVRQYLMRDHGEEAAQLAAFAELLAGCSAIVSFNGRAFDWPLIETRYRMNRQRPPLRDPLHLDLLFPTRRVWRERLESCALKEIEPAALGVRRRGDVPGWLIPGIYFQYIRDRDPRPLGPVFDHNLLDILSLSTLAARLAGVVRDPTVIDAGDAYGAGCLHEAMGRLDRAIACYEAALAATLPDLLVRRCVRRLSLIYKRANRWPAAVALWERRLGYPDPDLFEHEELAKYYEHVARDFRRASAIVDRALLWLAVEAARGPGSAATLAREWERRRSRLRAKLEGRRSTA